MIFKRELVLVLATSKESGQEYAEELGLPQYRVITTSNALHGVTRFKTYVIVPEFYREYEKAQRLKEDRRFDMANMLESVALIAAVEGSVTG